MRGGNILRARRDGAVLLEALVALAILGTVGAAATALAADAARTTTRVRESEREMRLASAFLDAVALWTRDDLDRHLGVRRQGDWTMRLDRPVPTLYVVTLSDTLESRELLRTALYRADPRRREIANATP
jgi:type II secretory pathway pseudopilin PulG